MIGTTLAHYRITAALGAGGMGEVWRATDTKLDREVALKVLPPDFAADPDRMARFEREAKVLASLNHSNIAHLYGLENSVILSEAPGRVEESPEARSKNRTRRSPEKSGGPSTHGAGTPLAQDDRSAVTFLVMELGGEAEVRPLRDTDFAERFANLSPDGRYVAYESDESGRQEVQIQSFPDPGVRIQLTRDGGEAPLWARTSELFFWSGDRLFVVPVRTTPELTIGEPEALFESRRYTTNQSQEYDVSADGRRILMVKIPEASRPREAQIVVNWFTELERLAGPGGGR